MKCDGANFMVMGEICCKNFQVNAANNCTEQCPTAQFMNENRICKDCPSNKIVNAAKDNCLISCAAEAEITNAAGNACVTNCSSVGEITNTAGDACLTSCADGGEISDSDGNNQCNGNCADFGAKLILNSKGDACVPDCTAFGLFLNLIGDACVFDCNYFENQVINVAGNGCVTKCPEGQFLTGTTNTETWACCASENGSQCGIQQGQCSNDDDCFLNLKCGTGNCQEQNPLSDFPIGSNCCYDPFPSKTWKKYFLYEFKF